MKHLLILFFAGWSVIFFSCKTTQTVTAPAPQRAAFKQPPVPKVSSLYLPISLPVKRVNELAEGELPKILYEEKERPLAGGAKLNYRVERTGKLTVKPLGQGQLEFNIPVKIAGRTEWKSPEKIGFQIGDLDLSTDVKSVNLGKDFSFNYDVNFKTKLELTPDWNLDTRLLGRFDWGKVPQFMVGDYKLNFDQYVGTGLQSFLNERVEKLEKKIQGMVNIKEKIQPAWNELNKPMKVYGEPPVWLQLVPEKVNFVTRENKSKDTLKWNLGVTTRIQTFVGSVPEASKPDKNHPLPQISNSETSDNRFFLHLPVAVSYDDLSRIAAQQLTAQEWDAGKYKVKFLQTEIKSDGEKLLIFLDFQAQKKGKAKLIKAKIWLQARPSYDLVSETLSAEDLDFDLETRKALLNVADWLLHGFILKKAQEAARYSLKADLEKAKQQLTQTLSDLDAGPYLKLKGKADKLKFDNLFLTERGIEVRILTEGTIEGRLK